MKASCETGVWDWKIAFAPQTGTNVFPGHFPNVNIENPLCATFVIHSSFSSKKTKQLTGFFLTGMASDNSGNVDCSVTAASISPLVSPTNLLQQTEDQIPSNFEGPFVNLLPPLLQEDYLLSLGEEEGISDLFDAYDLEKFPALVDEFLYS